VSAVAQPAVVTVVGGGVWVASLVQQLADALDVEAVDIRLVARDQGVLDVIARHCRHLARRRRPGWTVGAWPDLGDAVDGADAVALLHRVGGLAARQRDETLARRFGFPGDEGLGPGGLANAARTLPVLDEQADVLRRRAGTAPILNLVAPLGLTTRLLAERGLRVVGICELPGVTHRGLAAERRGEPWPAPAYAYAGFNHLGWFWPRSGTAAEAFAGPVAAGLVDPAALARFQAAPLKYYYWLHDPEAAARLGITRDPGRTERLMRLRARALDDFRTAPALPSAAVAARATPWLDDALVPVLASILAARPWIGYANVVNGRLVPALCPDAVVEVPARFDGGAVEPEPLAGEMPAAVLRFLRRVDAWEHLAYQSWRADDPALVADALVEGPHEVERPRAEAVARAIAAHTLESPPRRQLAAM
jgi:6-phospho-beta-glucosidase